MKSATSLTAFLPVLLVQFGCAAIVRPTFGSAEFLTDQPKRPMHVALCASEAFRTYSSKQLDLMDEKLWQLELGTAAADALRYALESRFESVVVRGAAPQFPLPGPAPALVVVPSIDSVKLWTPLVFKFEPYAVTLTMSVTVYDASGNELKRTTVTAKGQKAGSIGYESAGHAALPEACRLAIKQAVTEIMGVLNELPAPVTARR